MKAFVGLSGGVDSSVAAALLQRAGHDVTAIYMKNWTEDLPGAKCPWQEDLRDARAVASELDIPLLVYDFQVEYRAQVVDYMIAEYQAGRTPNPDIMCNQEIKFKLFLAAASNDGAEMVGTGHYATVKDGRLLRSVDQAKDQTYFLYRINGDALRKVTMPIGEYKKPQVRELATSFGLSTAQKKDSQGICFVGSVGMKTFLQQYVETHPGPIVMRDGREIGQHDGAIFYTIGQRQGLGVGGGKPFYVLSKNMTTNTVVVTDDPEDLELHSNNVSLQDMHWINGEPADGKTYLARFRHRGELVECKLETVSSDVKLLTMIKPVKALASGQSAVIYDGEECLGGGIIADSFPA